MNAVLEVVLWWLKMIEAVMLAGLAVLLWRWGRAPKAAERDASLLPPFRQPSHVFARAIEPTIAGGTDGKVILSWVEDPWAVSYDAYRIVRGARELVEADVHSPYVFTGFSAGTYTVGIEPVWEKAIAS